MPSNSLILPYYFLIVKRHGTQWLFKGQGQVFYSPRSTPGNPQSTPETMTVDYQLQQYQLTQWDVVVTLFRLRGGQAGYYLMHLKQRQGYYCGTAWEDVRQQLQSLGIGRPDPFAS